jgi:hypothetical protein
MNRHDVVVRLVALCLIDVPMPRPRYVVGECTWRHFVQNFC